GEVTRVDDQAQTVQVQIADRVRVTVARASIGGYQGAEPVVQRESAGGLESMYKNLRWKFLVTALVTVVAVWAFMPPKQKVKLGLDLQGGLELIYRVETDA